MPLGTEPARALVMIQVPTRLPALLSARTGPAGIPAASAALAAMALPAVRIAARRPIRCCGVMPHLPHALYDGRAERATQDVPYSRRLHKSRQRLVIPPGRRLSCRSTHRLRYPQLP